jgi:large subunit ribosomal protein L10
LTDKLVGPLAYGISKDPVSAAKVMHEYAQGERKARL